MKAQDSSANYIFDDFVDMFIELDALATPAELHGLLCGHLSAGQRLNPDTWLAMVLAQLDVQAIGEAESRLELVALYELGLKQLNGSNFEFQPLLP